MFTNTTIVSKFAAAASLAALFISNFHPAAFAQAMPGLFQVPQYSTGAAFPIATEAVDLNGDGRKDLVVALEGTNAIGVAMANAQNGFNALASYPLGIEPEFMALADLNNDGRIDAVVVDRGAGKIGVALGTVTFGFAAPTIYTVGGTPEFPNIADVTGDGKLDILFSKYNTNNFQVLPGNGAGGFGALTTIALGAGLQGCILCDVNGDGKKDLVGTAFGSNSLVVRLNSSPGVYGAEIWTSIAFQADTLAAGDLNGDGRQDIVFTDYNTASVGYALGQSNGTFGATVTLSPGVATQHVRVGDVNGDNKMDIIFGNESDAYASLRIGNGAGGFGAEIKLWGCGTIKGFAFADLNGDGVADVALAAGNNISMCYAASPGVFNQPPSYGTGGLFPLDIATVSLFGSGAEDLIVANSNSGSVSILQNSGTGTFTTWATLPMDNFIAGFAVGDLNSDGHPDIVTVREINKTMTIRMGASLPTLFNSATPYVLTASPYDIELCDVNNDGALDFILSARPDNNVTILWGNGVGSYTGFTNVATPGMPIHCAALDFDGDGDRDIVASLGTSSLCSVLTNNGAGAFATSTIALPGTGGVCKSGDLNWDGKEDLMITYNPSGVALMMGSPAGLGAPVLMNLPAMAGSILITDINADGNPDFLAGFSGGFIGAKLGNGTGALAATEVYAGGGFYPFGLTTADVDADGRAELIVTNSPGSNINGNICILESQLSSLNGVGFYGFGTPGCRGTHGVRANSVPSIGNSGFRITCTNAPNRSLGLALITNFADTLGNDVFDVDITMHILIPNMNNLIWADAYSDAAGNGGSEFPIPSDMSLVGQHFYGQFLWLWMPGDLCDPSTYNLSSSKGISLVIQQ